MEGLCSAIVVKAIEDYENAVVKRDSYDKTIRIKALYDMADIEEFVCSAYCGNMVDVDCDVIMRLLKTKHRTAKSDIQARKNKARSIYI